MGSRCWAAQPGKGGGYKRGSGGRGPAPTCGIANSTTAKDTHAIAMMFTGSDAGPRLKGPGLKWVRYTVTRSTSGTR